MPEEVLLVQQTYQDSTKKMGNLLNNRRKEYTHIVHLIYLYLEEIEVFIALEALCQTAKTV